MSEFTWGVILAGYLFLGGLSGGAYIIGAIADLMKKDEYAVLSKSGILASFVSIILGLVLLVLDLKRFEVAPLVILHAYTHFPESIMSIGTWIITAFTIVSFVTVLLWYLHGSVLIRKAVEVIGIVLGLATAAYTGILLSFARGVPFWGSSFLPWLFVLSGILTGLAIAVILIPIGAEFMPRILSDFKTMWSTTTQYARLIEYTDRYAQVIITLETLVMLLYFVTTPTTNIVWGGSAISMYFYAYILLALLLPLGISVYNLRLVEKRQYRTMIYLTLIASMLVLIGGFLLRYIVLIGGQMIY
ncbi:NrfD/PsrC family molybdoenzyme membrane anchor subunit [Thermoproteota archaeon]